MRREHEFLLFTVRIHKIVGGFVVIVITCLYSEISLYGSKNGAGRFLAAAFFPTVTEFSLAGLAAGVVIVASN